MKKVTLQTKGIRESVESFISKEKRMNSEIEKYQIALECESDDAEILSNRINIMDSQLKKEVETTCKHYKITPIQFIDLTVEFENRNLDS